MTSSRSRAAVPINTAEAIVEPFWDPQLSGLAEWKIRAGARHGLKVSQIWCAVAFEWVDRPVSGPALSLSLARRIDCAEYDRLLWVVLAPPGSTATLAAETDRGPRRISKPADPVNKIEVSLPLRGAREIRRITLELSTDQAGAAGGWMGWVGLQNTRRLKDHLALWDRTLPPPERHLAPPRASLSFEPAYGIAVDPASMEAARRDPDALRRAADIRRAARRFIPETLRNECLRVKMDNRYNRVRHHVRPFHIPCCDLAWAGAVLKDAGLLRQAARTALALAMCPNWEENVISEFPGGIFEHRCFTHTELMSDLCRTMDLAAGAFSETGRDYLLRRMAEEGLGRTNFIVWKHDYIFRNNQLAAFAPGRMAAYGILSRHWQHVEPYIELAYRELVENFDSILLPDGGYAEGPSYFSYGVGNGLAALEIYARIKGVALADVMPERMRKTGDFALCLGSTTRETDVIPFGDATPVLGSGTLSYFARCAPGGGWDILLAKARAREGGEGAPELAWPPFIRLPHMGCLASHRKWQGEWVKIFVSGCTRDADHNHEDKGGFVLEWAGDVLACDPGRHRFAGSPAAALVKHVELHNMLAPYGEFPERPHPELPHPTQPWPAGITAEGTGDESRFQARVDAVRGFEAYFNRWTRTYESPAPDRFTVTDDYAVAQGDGVDFFWQTTGQVEIGGGTVRIRARRGGCVLTLPPETSATVEVVAEEAAAEGAPPVVHRRVRIRRPGREGKLSIHVQLLLESI